MSKKKKMLFVIMNFLLLLLFSVPVFAETGTVHSGTNEETQNYPWNYATVIDSYLTECADGTLMRVQYVASESQVIVEYYDENYELLDMKEIPQELPIFGGFYAMNDSYYLVTGQTNHEESADVEVYRITKYDTKWNRLESAGLYDCNTTIPFDAGSLRMDSEGKYLMIRTCHEMYTAEDGYNHQANVTIQLDTESMEITDSYTKVMNNSYGYVSHSFNQFIRIDDKKIAALDHGDAHPRSLVLCLYPTDVSKGKFASSGVKCVDVLGFPGEIGANRTGATVGGFEVSEQTYLVAGTSIIQDDIYASRSTQNAFLASVDKTTNKVTFEWLTDYEEGETSVNTPQLVKISDDRFLILWSRNNAVYYTECDGNGTTAEKVYCIEQGNLSDCKPIVKEDSLIWYVWKNGKIAFYEINLNRIGKPQVTILEDEWKTTNIFCADGTHNIEKKTEKAATCTEDGYSEHWGCTICGMGFADENGTVQLKEHEYLYPAGHQYVKVSQNGNLAHLQCSVCKAETDKGVFTSLTAFWNENGGNSYSTAVSPNRAAGTKLYSLIEYGETGTGDEIVIEISDPDIANYIKTSSYYDDQQLGYFEFSKTGEVTITIRSRWNPDLKKVKTFTVTCSDHDWETEYTIDEEPTCTKGGSKSIHCQNCEAVKDVTEIGALDHNWSTEWLYDERDHWYGCSRCSLKKDLAEHYGGTGSGAVICEGCGHAYEKNGGRHPFIDVFESDWFDSAVQYMYDEHIMTGMSEVVFGPYGQLSRAQFAVMLYRLEGEPEVAYTAKYPDIVDGTWYTKAVMWASENGIITGYLDGNFGPVDLITREQMATIMHRYAKSKGYDMSGEVSLDPFTDQATVSPFAKEAMQWTAGTGVITGKDNGTRLAPQEHAARAECALIFMRFMEKY